MSRMIDLAVNNMGVSFEWAIMIIIVFCGLIFYARGASLGLMLHWIMGMGVFMWFYSAGYQWQIPLTFSMMSFVAMCLMMYLQAKSVTAGAIV
jgi:hypothetical protein